MFYRLLCSCWQSTNYRKAELSAPRIALTHTSTIIDFLLRRGSKTRPSCTICAHYSLLSFLFFVALRGSMASTNSPRSERYTSNWQPPWVAFIPKSMFCADPTPWQARSGITTWPSDMGRICHLTLRLSHRMPVPRDSCAHSNFACETTRVSSRTVCYPFTAVSSRSNFLASRLQSND